MLGGEDAAELSAKGPLAGQAREEGPEPAAQQALSNERLGQVQQHAAVEEQRAPHLHPQRATQVASHQLGDHRGAYVMADDEHRRRAGAAHQLLGGVGLQASV